MKSCTSCPPPLIPEAIIRTLPGVMRGNPSQGGEHQLISPLEGLKGVLVRRSIVASDVRQDTMQVPHSVPVVGEYPPQDGGVVAVYLKVLH